MIEKLQEIKAKAKDEAHEIELLNAFLTEQSEAGLNYEKVRQAIDRLRFLAREHNDKISEGWSWNREAYCKLRQGETEGVQDALACAIDLYQEIGNEDGLSSSYLVLGLYYQSQGDFKLAIDAYLNAAEYSRNPARQELKRSAYSNVGLSYSELGDYEQSVKYYTASMKLMNEKTPAKSKAILYNNIASNHTLQGNYAQALKDYFHARDLSAGVNDAEGLLRVHCGLGDVHRLQGRMEDAVNHYHTAIKYAADLGKPLDIAVVNLGVIDLYIEMEKYAEAEELLAGTVTVFEEAGDQRSIASCYLGMGELALKQLQWTQAFDHYTKSLSLHRKVQYKDGIAKTLIGLSLVHNHNKDYQSAIEALTEASQMARDMESKSLLKSCLLALSDTHAALGRHEEALFHYREYHRISTDILGEETRRQMNQLSFQHNLDQVEKNLELEKNARRAEEEKNILLSAQKNLIEKSLHQRETLLKEIHHRVKNNLQIISSLLELQSINIEDKQAKAAISEGQNRVRSIALIHNKLYQADDIAAIEFKSFTTELYKQIASIFKEAHQEIEVFFDIAETHLDIDTAVPLGLILNELITNAFKYAFGKRNKGALSFLLKGKGDGQYELIVKDDGKGLPENIDIRQTRSLGLRLINNLSRQIGGNTQYHFDGGSVFTINFIDTGRRKLID